jgi:hypothetical protein
MIRIALMVFVAGIMKVEQETAFFMHKAYIVLESGKSDFYRLHTGRGRFE